MINYYYQNKKKIKKRKEKECLRSLPLMKENVLGLLTW